MKKGIALLLILAGSLSASAQSVAIRFIIGETNKVYERPTFDNYCFGVGVDRSFNDKFTAGFDVAYDIGHALRSVPQDIYLTNGGYTATYGMSPRLLTMNYHTEYALGDDGSTHCYIGTFIGLRHISQKWDLQYTYNPSGNPVSEAYPSAVDLSQWLVPIGLRMGLRGATDGGFVDLYAAVGYQIGGGDPIVTGSLYQPGIEFMETSSLAVSIGLAYGIGW